MNAKRFTISLCLVILFCFHTGIGYAADLTVPGGLTPPGTPVVNSPVLSEDSGSEDERPPSNGIDGAVNFIETMLPNVDSHGIEKLYTKYPMWNYTLDTDSSWYDPVTPAIMMLINLEVVADATFVRMGIMVLEQAYTLDLLDKISIYIGDFIEAYKKSTWDVFLTPGIVIIGLYILFNSLIASRKSKSLDVFLKSFFVIGFATVFLAYPKDVLVGFNDVSREISASVLTSTLPIFDGDASDINQAVAVAGNQLWENQVLYPWYYMQFGSAEDGKVKAPLFLTYSKGSNLREKNMKLEIKAGNKYMTEDSIYLRVIMLGFTHFINIIVLILLIIVCILIILSQLAPLLLVLLSPLIFTVALIPNYGMRIIQKWMERVLGGVFFKVVMSMFLSLYIVASNVFRAIFGEWYLLQIFVQLLVILAIVLERKRIIGIFSNIGKGPDAVAEAATQKSNWGEQIGNVAKKSMQAAVTIGAAAYTGGASMAGGAAMLGGRAGMLAKGVGIAKNFAEAKENKVLHPMADGLLNQRFLQQKDSADSIAQTTGQNPRYNPFVSQVMERTGKGLPPFTSAQRENALHELRDIKRQGGDPARVFNPADVPGADDPLSYKMGADRHKQRLAEKYQDFESKRQNRAALITASEQIPIDAIEADFAPPPPLNDFSQVGDVDMQASEVTRTASWLLGNNDRSNGPEGPKLDSEATRMAADRVSITTLPSTQISDIESAPIPTEDKELELLRLIDKAGRNKNWEQFGTFSEQLETLQAARIGGTPEGTGPNRIGISGMDEGSLPIPPVDVSRDSYINHADLLNMLDLNDSKPLPPAAASGDQARTIANRVGNFKNERDGQPISSGLHVSEDGGRTPSDQNNDVRVRLFEQPMEGAFQNRERAEVALPVRTEQPIQTADVDAEMKELGMQPIPYVNQLKQDRQAAYGELRALELYQNIQGNEKMSQLMPDVQVRAEQILQSSGQSVEDARSSAQSRYDAISEKLSVATEHLQVKPKQYIDVPAEGQGTRRIEIKTPVQYQEEIHTQPIEQLSFVVKEVDEGFRQSVLNDWHQNSHQSPEQYIGKLYEEHVNRLVVHKNIKSGAAVDEEYTEVAKRSRALLVDATKRYEVAKALLNVDDGRGRTKYRKK